MKQRVGWVSALIVVFACGGDDAGRSPAVDLSDSGSGGEAEAGSGGMGAGGGGASGRAGAGGRAAGSGGSGAGAGVAGGGATELPPELCSSALALVDTGSPTSVVGSGAPDSCSEAALRTAVAQGGVITFDCGTDPTTITLKQTLIAPSDRDTTIDGDDRIVLDGGGSTQILRAFSSDFRANDHVLTVQRLVMQNGRDVGTGLKARDGDKTCAFGYKDGGGGAIYTRDVIIHAYGVRFLHNQGPELGPDVAGGAIYSAGSKALVVARSVFRGNSASNGGAIGLLQTSAQLYNVVFEANRASGLLANFANDAGCPTFNHAAQGGAGGLGGAFYSDGDDPGDTFCGVRMTANISGDLGGAVFRSAYWQAGNGSAKQTMHWDQTTLERNQSPVGGGGAGYLNNALFVLERSHFVGNSAGPGDGGALKLTGLTLQADDVEFTNNQAKVAGAVAFWDPGPEGAGTVTNIRFSGNKPNDYAGDYPL